MDTSDFRNGLSIILDNDIYTIVEFQHVKPGKGGAFVRTKVKNLDSGAVVDRTFRAGEKFPRVRTEVKNMQFLYESGDEVVFMDQETYEQTSVSRSSVADAIDYMEPSAEVQMLTVNGETVSVQAEVRRCRPAPRGGYEVGVEFVGVDPRDQRRLKAYLKAR